MPRTRPPYPPEYRRQIVDLVRARSRPRQLAKEFGLAEGSVRTWVKEADLDEGRRHDGLTTDERLELARLRRENHQLRLEREILAKATAWFARETGSLPPEEPASS